VTAIARSRVDVSLVGQRYGGVMAIAKAAIACVSRSVTVAGGSDGEVVVREVNVYPVVGVGRSTETGRRGQSHEADGG
jgi:hypothetical protein